MALGSFALYDGVHALDCLRCEFFLDNFHGERGWELI